MDQFQARMAPRPASGSTVDSPPVTERRFLGLLWAYVGTSLAALASLSFPDYSDGLAAAYAAEPEAWLLAGSWAANGVMGALMLACLVGLVGLFRFKAWGRTVSLYATPAALVVEACAGATLSSGVENALLGAASMLWGAVLALAYFSPVRSRFGP